MFQNINTAYTVTIIPHRLSRECKEYINEKCYIFIKTTIIAFFLSSFCLSETNHGSLVSKIKRQLGPRDAVLLSSPQGQVLVSHNPDKMLIPASTLKILTCLAALYYLKKNFRFQTEFYLDNQNLTIKGYGDPLIISEVMPDISQDLSRKMTKISDLILDVSYFGKALSIPGVTSGTDPYNAPNGALCVNFNTVNFTKVKGKYQSAEEQTPLLNFALKRIKKTGITKGRIVFTQKKNECALYAGNMFKYFLTNNGVKVDGEIKIGTVEPRSQLIYTYVSVFPLDSIVTKILRYSNNFMTNQILLILGGEKYGPPCTLAKGIRVLKSYVDDVLHLRNIYIVEGSGISRQNKISAQEFLRILDMFKPYHSLLKKEEPFLYKSGTLSGISTRAGYIVDNQGNLNRFIILLNTSGRSAGNLMKSLFQLVK